MLNGTLLSAIRRALAPALPVTAGLALAAGPSPAAAAGPATATSPASGTGTAPAGARLSFQVSTTADGHDAHPGDGRCADRAGRCTLRAAAEEAAAQPPGTAVSIGLPAGAYGLRLGSLDFDGGPLSLTGAGAPATVIRATGEFRVMEVGRAATATLSGVTITGGKAGAAGYGGGVLSAGRLAPREPAGYNLDSGSTCAFARPTDLTGASPRLGPLAANGGPTRTLAPGPGSPAIDHGGTPATGCPATDQRGVPRPQGPACDIGAVEVGAPG